MTNVVTNSDPLAQVQAASLFQDRGNAGRLVLVLADSKGGINFVSILDLDKPSFQIMPSIFVQLPGANFTGAFRTASGKEERFVFTSEAMVVEVGWVQGVSGVELGIVNRWQTDRNMGIARCASRLGNQLLVVTSPSLSDSQGNGTLVFLQQNISSILSLQAQFSMSDLRCTFCTWIPPIASVETSPGLVMAFFDKKKSLLFASVFLRNRQESMYFPGLRSTYVVPTSRPKLQDADDDPFTNFLMFVTPSEGKFKAFQTTAGVSNQIQALPSWKMVEQESLVTDNGIGFDAPYFPTLVENNEDNSRALALVQSSSDAAIVYIDISSNKTVPSYVVNSVSPNGCLFAPACTFPAACEQAFAATNLSVSQSCQ